MSNHLKKHLTAQLELLYESSFHLQSSISGYIHQVKTKALGYIDNTTDTNMTVKDVLVMVATAQSIIFEHVNLVDETTTRFTTTVMTGDKTTTESKSFISAGAQHISTVPMSGDSETMRRLKDIEATLTSLQDTKQKTEDDISEIKQWRDNFVTEQSDTVINKQKQHFKNIRKQIHEQDKRMDELNKEIKDLKEKETKTDKALEKLSLGLREYKNNLRNINAKMQAHTDKHFVICKLLQQKLMPIDKMIETNNKNSNCREGTLKKIESLEINVLKLSQEFKTFAGLGKMRKLTERHGGFGATAQLGREPTTWLQQTETLTVHGQRFSQAGWFGGKANQQVEHPTLGFIASQGRWNGKYHNRSEVITFNSVERNVGNHFDPNTGLFTAPVDCMYKVGLTIKQTGDRAVEANVCLASGGIVSWLGSVRTKDKSVKLSRTFEVRMKRGEVLFSSTCRKELECTHFSCSFVDASIVYTS